jgi:hypothetical protein
VSTIFKIRHLRGKEKYIGRERFLSLVGYYFISLQLFMP